MSIITNAEVFSLARQNSGADTAKAAPYLSEAIELDIKPAIKDNLLIDLTTYVESDDPGTNEAFDLLLAGGTYEYNSIKYSFKGLKSATAYFAYARFIKGIDFNPTQFGLRVLDVDQSEQANYKDKIQFANDCISVANSYIYDCILYIKRMLPDYNDSCNYRKRRSKFKIIGD